MYTYDQDADSNKTESIHKLADIYHSNLIVVGPPEASTTSSMFLILIKRILLIELIIIMKILKMVHLVEDLAKIEQKLFLQGQIMEYFMHLKLQMERKYGVIYRQSYTKILREFHQVKQIAVMLFTE